MTERIKTPWHLWVVGLVALLWNSGGVFDFIMTQSHNADYLAQFSEAERAFFTGIPMWTVVFWAISVFSAALASLCLLLKRRWAEPLFLVALISFLIVAFQNYIIASPTMAEVVGTFATVFSAVIFAVTLACWWYAKRMRANGVLG